MNIDYKIASKTRAARLKKVFHFLIANQQTAYVQIDALMKQEG